MKHILKKSIPPRQWAGLRDLYYPVKLRNKEKIFCISMQRNGTSSCGQFLKDFGFHTANYSVSVKSGWTEMWMEGDLEGIFRSRAFRSHQAYEDSPWWFPDLYKYLYHRFPKANFILFHRDADIWFDSMLRHSKGRTPGNTYRHCKLYRRLTEYYEKLDHDPAFLPEEHQADNLLSLEGMRTHYIQIYREYNREAMEFFKKHDASCLFTGRLEDPDKWVKLGRFLNVSVEPDYNVHIKTPVRI